jgi:hypothetical protein
MKKENQEKRLGLNGLTRMGWFFAVFGGIGDDFLAIRAQLD